MEQRGEEDIGKSSVVQPVAHSSSRKKRKPPPSEGEEYEKVKVNVAVGGNSKKQEESPDRHSTAIVSSPPTASTSAPEHPKEERDVLPSLFVVWIALGGIWAELQPISVPASAANWYLHDLKDYLISEAQRCMTLAERHRTVPASLLQFLVKDNETTRWIESHQLRFILMDGRRIPANRKLREVLAVSQDLVLQRIDASESQPFQSPHETQLPTTQAYPQTENVRVSSTNALAVVSSPTPPPQAPVVGPSHPLPASILQPTQPFRQVSFAVPPYSGELFAPTPAKSLLAAQSPQSSAISSDSASAILNRLVELEDKIDAKNAYFENAVKELRLLTASVRAAGGVAAMPGRNIGQILQLDPAVPAKQPKGSLENEHAGSVWALATNKEQTRLASGSSDTSIVLWDLQTLKPVQKLKGHTSIVHSLDMHGDNVISGSDDRTVRLWSAKDQYKCTKIVRSNDIPSCLKVSNNLLFQGTYKSVRVFNLEPELSLLKTIDAHNHWVRAICVSNAHLFTGSHGQIVQHDLATWKAQKTMTANCGSVYSIIVMDNLLYAATYENSIYIWDLRSYTTVRTLLGHTGAVYSLAFAPSNPTKLYSGSYDTSIRQWDLSSFTCSARLAGHSGSVEAMVLTGDGSSGQTLFSASRDSFINYWRP